MKMSRIVPVILIVFVLVLSACVPTSFSRPTEIHIDPGDDVEQAVVAVDGSGRSHIAGIVNDRLVYYRTRFGEPIVSFTFTMSGSGANWVQYAPDIAVMNNGTAYIVWIERHGGPETFVCWRSVPLIPPPEGYTKYCNPMDGTTQAAGLARVATNGTVVYAVYDRLYTDDGHGRIYSIRYKELTNTSNTGDVYWYIDKFETGYIYSMDMQVDVNGKLHTVFMENYTTTGLPPYTDRLAYRSNVSVLADGTMSQIWNIVTGTSIGEDTDVSLSLHTNGGVPRVACASIWTPSGIDQIYVDSCDVSGCANKNSHQVALPASWNSYSVIDDLEVLGIGENLYVSFIGDDNTAPTGAPQVYYLEAYSGDPPVQPSGGSATFKLDLEMTRVAPRPESDSTVDFPVMVWGESNLVTNKYFVYDGLFSVTKVSEDTCGTSLLLGDINSNGVYFSGVWDACGDTWFTTQAWDTNIPMLFK